MSQVAQRIEEQRRNYVRAMGTPLESAERAALEYLVEQARKAKR